MILMESSFTANGSIEQTVFSIETGTTPKDTRYRGPTAVVFARESGSPTSPPLSDDRSDRGGANGASAARMSMPVGGSSPPNLGHRPLSMRVGGTANDEEDEQTFVDEFGFELTDSKAINQEATYVKNIDGKTVLRREVKWAKMTSDWDRTNTKMYDKLKDRVRKGIPNRLRGIAWQLLVGARQEMDKVVNHGVYNALKGKPIDGEWEAIIERDLGRTFPTHTLFRGSDGAGQTQLRSVLHAYASIDPEVSYVQGMGFIVGTLLTQMSEEEAFWTFHEMMHCDRYRMRDMYKPGFPMLQLFFYQLRHLLAQQLPKLAAYFDELHVDMSFFSAQWFLTLFVYHFTFRALLRIWDIFMCEGWKIIFRVALALMKWEERALLQMPFEQLLPKLKNLHEDKPPDEILTRALRIKFKTEELLKLRVQYEDDLRNHRI